jgi:predicted dehydrogenase
MKRKLRMGMVGGGRGAFIGSVHRTAAAMDGQIELVCGAFSGNAERSRLSGEDLYLPRERVYDNFLDMIEKERQMPFGERMDFISIVTPNHLHFEPARMGLENGFHIICDKPLAFNLDEALHLQNLVNESGLLFALTHNYTGYPMVKQARAMISNGELGEIRRVVVEYPQGWLSTKLEDENQKQASWRTDPQRSGIAGAMGDIGTHAENLAEYITGLQITELCSDLHIHVEGRMLDDDGSVLLRFNNGARGLLYASQISAGEENDLRIRVYGEYGGIEWAQQDPNDLIVKWLDRPIQIMRTGSAGLYPEAQMHSRIPAGHPEGYLEAFANIYRNFAFCLSARLNGTEVDKIYQDFPTVEDGVRGMKFLETVVKSSQSTEKWIKC